MSDPKLVDRVARALCRERCAFMGEQPCHAVEDEPWPPKACDEPGCLVLALAAVDAMKEEAP